MKTYLFNPFEKIAGFQAFFIGLAFMLLATLTGWLFYGRYDGVLDMHFTAETSFWAPLFDNLINIGSLTLIFYLNALMLKGIRVRFIDMLGTVTLARWPLFLLPLGNIGNHFNQLGFDMETPPDLETITEIALENIGLLIIVGIISIAILVWYVALLWKAYTVSAYVKGTPAVLSFIVGLIAAEILSKFLIYKLV